MAQQVGYSTRTASWQTSKKKAKVDVGMWSVYLACVWLTRATGPAAGAARAGTALGGR